MIDFRVEEKGDLKFAVLSWDLPGRSMNVVNEASMTAFAEAVERVAKDPALSGAVVTSAKDAFIAGADLDMIEKMASGGGKVDPAELEKGIGAWGRILRRMETCGKPFAAAINGTALGGGFELALACQRRFAADEPKAKIGLPEATLGLLPGAGGTQRVPRLVGIEKALGMLSEGKSFSPAEAKTLGLVDQVLPKAELLDAALSWLATKPAPTQPWDRKDFQVPGGGPDEARVRQTFMAANAMYRSKTFGNYPAGLAILSCVFEGLRLDIDSGLKVETRYMASLLLSPTSRNMIRTLFLGLQDANKLVRRPKGIERQKVEKLAVLGGGLMGGGIAFVAAKSGMQVVLLDRDAESAQRGALYGAGKLDNDVKKGKLAQADRDALLSRIQPTTSYADLAGCTYVVEAVFEDRKIKADVTRATEAVVPETAVFGSNTSTLPIAGLAEASGRPQNFIGVHFFSPVEKMQLVEVIVGKQTSPFALAATLDFVRQIGKTPIVVNDSRGFYTSRVFGTYLSEGLAMLVSGVKPSLIENAGKMSGMPMPPLGLADEVGLGLMHQVREQTRKDLGGAFKPQPANAVLDKLVVEGGRLGRKNGKGFYDYGDKGEKRLWPGLLELFPPAAAQPTAAALVERFLYIQCLEAARCMDEGVMLAAQDADVGAVLGWGFAPYTGGPLSYIDTVGAKRFVERAQALAAEHGERFVPCEGLLKMADSGGKYYA